MNPDESPFEEPSYETVGKGFEWIDRRVHRDELPDTPAATSTPRKDETMTLNGLEGRTVAVRAGHKWYAGVVKWGGKAGLRVVTADGRRIYRKAISAVVCLPYIA